ncbi:MAG: hypothetical protein IV107_18915 [Paucibacter sp.]|nr:hypothetical protein [Roseateles sp.]
MYKKLILAPLFALSAGLATASGWTEPLTIVSAFVEDSDYVIVYTSGGRQYVLNCGLNQWNFVANGEPRKNRAWATILTAIATGKKISFWYGDTCGVWGYHQATAVQLVN